MAQKQQPTLKGTLEAYWEAGMTSVAWTFLEDGKKGLESLNSLKRGDFLRVFNDASRKKVIFEGVVDLEYKRRLKPHPLNPHYKQQQVSGMLVRGLQKNVNPEAWAKMFSDGKPAELIKRKKQPAQPKINV